MSDRKLRIAPEAGEDIRHLLRYTLETWGRDQYIKYARRLKDAINLIRQFPGAGRKWGSADDDVRVLPVDEHVIFFRYDDVEVEVIRVLHSRMDSEAQMANPSA